MSRHQARPGKEFWLAALRHDGALLDAAASDAGALKSAVPDRTGLTVGDVLARLDVEYRRVCGLLAGGTTGPAGPAPDTGTGAVARPGGSTRADAARNDAVPDDAMPTDATPHDTALHDTAPDDTAPDDTAPDDAIDDGVLDRWRRSYRELLRVLDAVDADHPAANRAPQPKRAGFWHRRMAHRTALDRWDVQVATGTTEPLEAKSASDGITEYLDTVLVVEAGDRPHEPTGTVRLIAADTGYEWLVRLRPTGLAMLDLTGPAVPRVRAVAAGTASDLWLALTGRIDLELLRIVGDERLLAQLVPQTERSPSA